MWVGRRAGDHHSPGDLGLRSRRGFQCRPPSPAPPGQGLPGPCPGCTTQPVGPQLLSSGVPAGHWDPRLTTSSSDPPPLLDFHGDHLPCPGLPGAPARSPSSVSPPPRQGRGWGLYSTRRHSGSAWMGPAVPPPGPGWHLRARAAQGLGPTSPCFPITLSHWSRLGSRRRKEGTLQPLVISWLVRQWNPLKKWGLGLCQGEGGSVKSPDTHGALYLHSHINLTASLCSLLL